MNLLVDVAQSSSPPGLRELDTSDAVIICRVHATQNIFFVEVQSNVLRLSFLRVYVFISILRVVLIVEELLLSKFL